MRSYGSFHFINMRFALLFLLVITMVPGCTDKSKITLTTDYQVVFLDNGQTFIGKIEMVDSPYPLLKDVFYIQRQVNKDTNEVKNILIKRGSEWHGPDRMYINSKHIVLIEPVSPKSMVAKLIKEAKEQKVPDGKE